ncbi:MAG: 2-succinyl-5-enolpyruvyl-6-hydroxy-3-cyclohexene-1-carboxylic-acid synthase, partial [Candidatus Eisenbacteria bacterium]|nr:2-succinyl-5-enolpyruvyl-6-hydroxy-3-cyclohexene-1-carboxylic-acid synthase [Candidatus Eisenbacteria bacterium]
HLNIPFPEPLTPEPVEGDLRLEPGAEASVAARPTGRPYLRTPPPARRLHEAELHALTEELQQCERGLIVAGPQTDSHLAPAVSALAARLGYPILADPLSQMRCGHHDRRLVVDSYDLFLRSEGIAADFAPDIVLRLGGLPTSKPLSRYLKRHAGARQIVIDPGPPRDPMHLLWDHVRAGETEVCRALAGGLPPGKTPSAWPAGWIGVAAAARKAANESLERMDGMFEGALFAKLGSWLAEDTLLLVGNSMPVRDLDAFLPAREAPLPIAGNRGLSGIDGLVSTALGAAAAGRRVTAVLGDVSFYHDLNGLLAVRRHGLAATFIVINNDGGGIFSFLPQAQDQESFDRLFAMPHGLSFGPAAEMFGLDYVAAEDWDSLHCGLLASQSHGKAALIEMRGDRESNRRRHEHVWSASVAAAEKAWRTHR